MPNKLKQIGSILLTFFIYQFLLGWKISLLLVGAILFHEMCHIFMAKYLNLKTGGMVMLPFIGGVSFIVGKYKSYTQQVWVVLAGPIGGATLSLLTYGVWLLTGYTFLLYATYWVLLVNCLNMAPLSFLDGGQIMDTITYSFNEKLGFYCRAVSAMVAVIVLYFFNPILALFVGVFGLRSVYVEYNNRKYIAAGQTWMLSPGYLNKPLVMTTNQIMITLFVWLGSAGMMLWLMSLLPMHGLSLSSFSK